MSFTDSGPFQTKLIIDDESEIDITYANLPEEVRLSLDYVTLTIVEIRWVNEERRSETVQQIFENLNRGGVRLEKQEVRNGVYGCRFYDMLHEINRNNKDWRSVWGKDSTDCKDLEMLLKFCAWKKYIQFKNGEFIFEKFPRRSDYMLDSFSEYVMKLDDKEEIIEEYRNSLVLFCKSLPENYKITKANLLESIYVVLEKTNIKVNLTKEMIAEIQSSEAFKSNSSQGTFGKKKMNERWTCVYEILSKYSG